MYMFIVMCTRCEINYVAIDMYVPCIFAFVHYKDVTMQNISHLAWKQYHTMPGNFWQMYLCNHYGLYCMIKFCYN